MTTDVTFEAKVARKYLSKRSDAEQRGIEFSLSIRSMENLMKAKTCYYTGFVLTEPDGGHMKATDRTIDRVDSTKGYVKGNVVACCNAANQLKAMCEGAGLQGYKMGARVLDKTIKRIQGGV
ncbi:hypothetical protein D3C85_1342250 [compost metagenome]